MSQKIQWNLHKIKYKSNLMVPDKEIKPLTNVGSTFWPIYKNATMKYKTFVLTSSK
jgi:hypothetical protein